MVIGTCRAAGVLPDNGWALADGGIDVFLCIIANGKMTQDDVGAVTVCSPISLASALRTWPVWGSERWAFERGLTRRGAGQMRKVAIH
jgi:hypothetical protein